MKRLLFTTLVVLTVLSMTIPVSPAVSAEPVPGGTLDPLTIPKYVQALTIPLAMPKTSTSPALDYYEIAVRQFQQQVLPPGMPKTTVWGYGSVNHPGTFSYPAYTIEAQYEKPVRVKWINGLVDAAGNYLPHLLPIDQTLHWANPPGGEMGRDSAGTDPNNYEGPVPMVAHLHGAHVTQDSDGYPEAWFLPAAINIPPGYAKVGSFYNQFKGEAETAYGQAWAPGTSVYQYPNDQRAATLWFHDHSLGMTRANVYAGPAGFYLIRGGPDDVVNGVLPSGAYEVPLVIQDKSFDKNGSLFYPKDRAFFEGLKVGNLKIPFVPDTALNGEPSDVSPIWNPEFFGNTIVVNGKTWPYQQVEAKQYRYRLLNASDSRFYIFKFDNDMPFWQIGSDGGFLPAPVEMTQLLLGPAERADIIVDFSGKAGTNIILQNIGPDEPFGGGEPGVDFDVSDPDTTGQVMQFRVMAAAGPDGTTPAAQLGLPVITHISGEATTRYLSLNELMSMSVYIPIDENGDPVLDAKGNLKAVPGPESDTVAAFGPQSAMLGTYDPETGETTPLPWMHEVTEDPVAGATEIWEIRNFTADAHPIHIHQIQFEIIDRTDQFGVVTGPAPGEEGFKDTVIVYPGDEGDNPGITRVKVKFDIPGLFVWHCHILSHEDNEMMRPFQVSP